jgi:hypothetical protein
MTTIIIRIIIISSEVEARDMRGMKCMKEARDMKGLRGCGADRSGQGLTFCSDRKFFCHAEFIFRPGRPGDSPRRADSPRRTASHKIKGYDTLKQVQGDNEVIY